ncbi:MAG: ribonuclease P protein component [Candidatus Kapaibacterium sp.]
MVRVSSKIPSPKNLIPMIRLQKDIDDLFANRKSLTRSGNQTTTISSIYYLRELPEASEPILFLLHAPKKFIKPAHERNKLKRWMREAIRKNEELEKIREILSEKKQQALLLLRSDFKPSKDHAWNQIEGDILIVMKLLLEKSQKSK